MGEERECRWRHVDQRHAGEGTQEQNRRVAQLGIGRTGHHTADFLHGWIGPQADDALGQFQADRPLGLETLGERAVVDQRIADRGDPADRLQITPANQHASAGRGSRAPIGSIDPGEGEQHLEKEDEGGDQGALRQILAAQFRHAGNQREPTGAGDGDLSAKRIGGVSDVGVAQQQELRRHRQALHVRHTLADRPELAGPARGKLAACENRQALAASGRIGGRPGDLSRTIAALIIDQDHLEGAFVILTQERTE